ncbi:hypothetical protein [Streptomyces sp. NPDC048637]|uniref:hypothetical protein n=1 Tax=Streptomyces sp. NPDC048637 TaxID=3155636 RepID=UPI00341B7660
MRRTNLIDPDGTWSGLTLDVRTRPRPDLCLRTAEHRLLLAQGGEPVLLGVVHPPAYGVDFFNDGHPDGYVDWYLHNGSWEILPLRPMPDADDSRVKAYRKQALDGTLPPVLLWWVSGLDCHLILDGHARFAAAIAESTEPGLLELHRTVPDDEADTETRHAVSVYEAELTRLPSCASSTVPASPMAPSSPGRHSPAGSTKRAPDTVPPGRGPCPVAQRNGTASPTSRPPDAGNMTSCRDPLPLLALPSRVVPHDRDTARVVGACRACGGGGGVSSAGVAAAWRTILPRGRGGGFLVGVLVVRSVRSPATGARSTRVGGLPP